VGVEAPVVSDVARSGAPSRGGVLQDLIGIARPRQWTKNLVCFAALVFAGDLRNMRAVLLAILVFAAFCLASGAVYAFNDVIDREEDRAHPVKRRRPVAAGRLSASGALAEAGVLAGSGLALSFVLAPAARWLIVAFLVLNLLYSLGLKRVPIIDVMAIASGFVLRVQAGVEAITAPQSAWIVLCMFFMALFLGFAKRRTELVQLPQAGRTVRREVLGHYSVDFLNLLLVFGATTAIVCYALYAVTVQANKTFLLSILPVVFGIARYMMLVLVEGRGEDPGEALTRDAALLGAALVWAGLSVAVLYFGLNLLPPR